MTSFWDGETIIACTILLAVVVIALALALWVSVWQCEQRWKDSGLKSKWQGATCVVEVKPGIWIPEKNYRSVEE